MKENMRKCIKCGRSPATEPDTTLYRFPKPGLKNSLRCKLMAKYCYPDAAWSTQNFQEKLHKDHRMLCNRHFKASIFVNKKLVRSSVPDEPCDEMASPVVIELSAVNLSPSDISSNEKQGIGIAKWSYIENFYEMDNNNPNFVFAPTLRKDHLSPNTKQKMKVKLAAQVLSHTVASGIFAKIAQGELTTEAATTANVLSYMDTLFDCLNSVSPDLRKGKPCATNLKKGSPHFKHLKKMIPFFKNLEFIGCRRAPSFLDGFEEIWRSLRQRHKDVKSLATRRLQQDPLDNLFGCIRGHCGSNTNPTAGQFVAGLKTAMLANLPQVSIGNCEIDDNDTILNSYKILLTPITDNSSTSSTNDMTDIGVKQVNIDYEENELTGEIQACAYVCGFIVKNHQIKCIACKKAFTSEVNKIHNFIAFKEYTDTKKALVYPSYELTMCVEKCATLINQILNNEAHHFSIKKRIVDMLKKSIKFEFLNNCKTHRDCNIIYIIESVFHICVKRFCTIENRRFSDESSVAALKRKFEILKHK